jgi:AAA15 family ATPase/GTPase
MILQFSFQNFASYLDHNRLDMEASRQVSEHWGENTFSIQGQELNKSAVIYGPNASGKSNIFAAFAFMKHFVTNSARGQVGDKIRTRPFKLEFGAMERPSHFECVFLSGGKKFRYGFEADTVRVTNEWLYEVHATKEFVLFLREGDGIDCRDRFKEGVNAISSTRDNALFLSEAARSNGQVSGKIVKWFRSVKIIQGMSNSESSRATQDLLVNPLKKEQIIYLLKKADLGIEDIIEPLAGEDEENVKKISALPEPLRRHMIHLYSPLQTIHTRYKDGDAVDTVSLNFEKEESEGTRKFFMMLGPVIQQIESGSPLLVDEMEAKLHPMLTKAILNLFHSNVTNPRNAQLIFTTHDTNLLKNETFRRDQIWFSEKDHQQRSKLYSLAEFKARKDATFDKEYFKGRFGAIPNLDAWDERVNTVITPTVD